MTETGHKRPLEADNSGVCLSRKMRAYGCLHPVCIIEGYYSDAENGNDCEL